MNTKLHRDPHSTQHLIDTAPLHVVGAFRDHDNQWSVIEYRGMSTTIHHGREPSRREAEVVAAALAVVLAATAGVA